MKFISKNQNLCLVLKHGLSAEPIIGKPATPGVYARFKGGELVVDDNNEELINMLKNHPDFNIDFICEDENIIQPTKFETKDFEPVHNLVNIEAGRIGKNVNPSKIKLSPDMKTIILETAKEMAVKMAPDIAKGMIKEMMPEIIASLNKTEEKIPNIVQKTESTSSSTSSIDKGLNKAGNKLVTNLTQESEASAST